MDFKKISEKTACHCLLNAVENTTDTFVRSVRRSNNLSDADFRNHIERDKKVTNENDCEEVCGLHGVSVEIWNEESSKQLMEKYLFTATISRHIKKNLCVIRFTKNNGLVKFTPNQFEYNEYHYDFYKEDSFTVSSLELIEMIPLIAE